MDTSLASCGQILRKLCMFKTQQSREPLPWHCYSSLGTTPHSNCHIFYLTPPIEVFFSIIESTRHKLRIAHGLILVTPSLCGWEASQHPGPSPTLGSLGLSDQRCHKSWMSLWGPPCAHGVLGNSHGELHDNGLEGGDVYRCRHTSVWQTHMGKWTYNCMDLVGWDGPEYWFTCVGATCQGNIESSYTTKDISCLMH